jgi:mannose-1-phosphate guanylyltransferase/phosphomannomutase
MQFVIQVGGKGTRVNSITKGGPKALIKLNNTTILDHQLRVIKKYSKKKIIILNNILFKDIENHLKKKKNFRYSIINEVKPLGTAGSLFELKHSRQKLFALVYGDLIIDFNFKELKKFHLKKNSDLTLVVHPNDHPFDSDKVSLDSNSKVTNFYNKKTHGNKYGNQCLSGICLFNKKILKYLIKNKFQDFSKNFIPKLMKNKVKIFGYITREYIKDAGTPKRLKQVEKDIINRIPNSFSLNKKMPAIFLDKDGIINKDLYNTKYQDIKDIYSRVPEAIKKINNNHYLVIIVTNQPAIAKGFVSEKKVQKDFRYLESLLSKNKSHIDRIYYCPHHPEKGFRGEIKKYKIQCNCRKPNNGMILQAIKDFNIDTKKSVMIGDRVEDYYAAKKSKIHFFLINKKLNIKGVKKFNNLFEFSKYYFN